MQVTIGLINSLEHLHWQDGAILPMPTKDYHCFFCHIVHPSLTKLFSSDIDLILTLYLHVYMDLTLSQCTLQLHVALSVSF